MSGRGKLVNLDQATAGSSLAQAVCDASGRVLLAAGVELTSVVLESLRLRGVTRLHIDHEMDAAEAEEQRRAVARRLARLFRAVGDDVLLKRLHQAVLAYRLEQLQ